MRDYWLSIGALLLAAPAFAQEPHELKSGVPHQGVVQPDLDDTHSFTVQVTSKSTALRLELSSPDAELDIYGTSPGFYEEEAEYGYGDDAGSYYIEASNDMSPWNIVVDRFTAPALETGLYTFEVSHALDVNEPANFTITCTLFDHEGATALQAGEIKADAVHQSSGCFQGYTIDVPKGASALRIDLFGADDDLVLLARRKRPPSRLNASVAEVNNGRGRKTLLINDKSQPKLRPGLWYVDVADPQNADRTANYKIHANFDDQPPEELLLFPAIPERHGPGQLGKSLAAVVELTLSTGGGSGTILDETGRILTNAHVVSRPDGEPTTGAVSVALSLDPSRPPVELFNARVAHFDMSRDLAILELVEGYYHQPLPVDLKLPYAPLAPLSPAGVQGRTQMTEPLWVVGHPWTGGFGQRTPLSVTAGVVTGFDRIEAGTVIKTDAEIASGNSGGAAFDSQGRLSGVPTFTVGDSGDKIGYLHPIEMIPAAWLRR